jgi:hypothetical protein
VSGVRAPETNRLYARVANFPNKLCNLRSKIEALRDEAAELGFREEAAHLTAMAVFANCIPDRAPKLDHWSNQEVAKLKGLWLEGVSTAEIGHQLGKSDNAIQKAAKRFGLPRRKVRAA